MEFRLVDNARCEIDFLLQRRNYLQPDGDPLRAQKHRLTRFFLAVKYEILHFAGHRLPVEIEAAALGLSPAGFLNPPYHALADLLVDPPASQDENARRDRGQHKRGERSQRP